MRLLKKPYRIQINKNTQSVEPFRSFWLTNEEIKKIDELPKDSDGSIKTNRESENLLKEILQTRDMENLLYPEQEKDDWSGYVQLLDDGLFWML